MKGRIRPRNNKVQSEEFFGRPRRVHQNGDFGMFWYALVFLGIPERRKRRIFGVLWCTLVYFDLMPRRFRRYLMSLGVPVRFLMARRAEGDQILGCIIAQSARRLDAGLLTWSYISRATCLCGKGLPPLRVSIPAQGNWRSRYRQESSRTIFPACMSERLIS